MSSVAAADAPRRSNAVLAAFSGPCLPLAAFGVALPVTLPEFYATHVGLELGVVAAVFMAVRLIDIVFDPFIGWGMDKTKTAFGRYRPWMLVSTPILMLSALMMFVLVQPGAGPAYLFAWLLVLYLGFSIGTLGQLGWAAVLAPQYDQRSRVYGWWQVFNIIGVILILILPTIVVKTGLGNYVDGVRIMGWAIIIALPLTIGLAMVAVPEPVNAGAAPHGGPSAYLALFKMKTVRKLSPPRRAARRWPVAVGRWSPCCQPATNSSPPERPPVRTRSMTPAPRPWRPLSAAAAGRRSFSAGPGTTTLPSSPPSTQARSTFW